MAGPLQGLRIVEMASIGPGPFCCMMLADHGAEVIRIDRPGGVRPGRAGDPRRDVLLRSRRHIALDLKSPEGIAVARDLAASADGLVEGLRPGVMERLGLGPDSLLGDNPRLVYGRMTGWGQSGPYARLAGHDINYIALSGALHAFGPAGGKPTRDDLTVTHAVSSYQLPFVEHCIRKLKPGGRAAIVVPDNVLFEDGRGRELRRMMMEWCDLHTILRLPTGIFYAQGVKTNVMFLTKKSEERVGATMQVWFYDLRAQMPNFGKTRTLTAGDFAPFVMAYGKDPLGNAKRTDEGEAGRFRVFTREDIAKRNDNLDISWLREDEEEVEEGLTEPDDIAAAILGHLRAALDEIESVADELAETAEVEA